MFIIKTFCDYFWQIVPFDKAVLTQEMKDLLKLYLVSKYVKLMLDEWLN